MNSEFQDPGPHGLLGFCYNVPFVFPLHLDAGVPDQVDQLLVEKDYLPTRQAQAPRPLAFWASLLHHCLAVRSPELQLRVVNLVYNSPHFLQVGFLFSERRLGLINPGTGLFDSGKGLFDARPSSLHEPLGL